MPVIALKGIKLIIYSLLGGDFARICLPLFTTEQRLQLIYEKDKFTLKKMKEMVM